MKKIQIVGEIGLNYAFGPDRDQFIFNAKRLIDVCAVAKCDYVKLQKRTPRLCVPEEQKNKLKVVPWRKESITYLQYKEDIEFNYQEYSELMHYALSKNIKLFASVWDWNSVEFMSRFTDIVKIPSAHLTNWELLKKCKNLFSYRLISTGMSTEKEIEKAIEVFDPHVVFHTNSTYPTPIENLNMGYIDWLRVTYPDKEIGYSNHYYGLVPLMASVYLKVNWVEFHVCLSHANWGSDQLSSVEPAGIFKVVKGIRDLELSYLGDQSRNLLPGEEEKLKSLRG